MKTILFRFLIAAVFAAAAWLSWSESTLVSRVADAKQGVATFDFDDANLASDAATWSDYLPGARRRLSDEVGIARANVAYWRGRYDAVAADTPNGSADAEILLAAANAAFRESQRAPSTGPAAVQRLDGVLQAYASAMKASRPGQAPGTAAYNYEYVARVRDQVAKAPIGKVAKAPPSGPRLGGDLPIGPTIHGAPGAPPPEAKMEELQMIAPMEYGEREAQPEATPGAKRERKG